MALDLKNFSKNDILLVAVSGGADSMALLDMLKKENFNLIVLHVNYHFRTSSNRDQKIVEDYCKKNDLKCIVYEPKGEIVGNKEQWAREERYHFFKRVYDSMNASCLLLAHHRDDVIETYIFRKRRKSIGEFLTLPMENDAFGMRIYRPLYNMSKKNIYAYCVESNLCYGFDETNLDESIARNKIRMELKDYNEETLNKMFISIVEENAKWMEKLDGIFKKHDITKPLIFSKLLSESLDSQILIVYHYVVANYKSSTLARKLSRARVIDYLEKLKNKVNISLSLIDGYFLVREYDNIFVKKLDDEEYMFVLNDFELLKTKHFEIALSGKNMEGIYVSKEDYPLCIRPYRASDYVALKIGKKKVSRLYIDKKVPLSARKQIPCLLNSKNEIILIPGLYKDFKRKSLQSNLFMIKYHKY